MAKTRFQRKLEDRIKEAVEKRKLFLASGGAEDYPGYRESVGYLLGMQEALALCEEIESED